MDEGERRSLESCIGIASEEGWIEDDERERLEGELRGLREAAAALDAARSREAALVAALREITADEWVGWGDDGYGSRWLCFWCYAGGDMEEDTPPAHKDTCPVVRGRALVAAPDAKE